MTIDQELVASLPGELAEGPRGERFPAVRTGLQAGLMKSQCDDYCGQDDDCWYYCNEFAC